MNNGWEISAIFLVQALIFQTHFMKQNKFWSNNSDEYLTLLHLLREL